MRCKNFTAFFKPSCHDTLRIRTNWFFFFGVCVCLFVFLSHPKSLERVQTGIFGPGTLFFESTVLLGGPKGS